MLEDNKNPIHRQVGNDVNSVIEIIDSKDHLRRNMERIRLSRIRNYKAENSTYRHEIEFNCGVKTAGLWEPARP